MRRAAIVAAIVLAGGEASAYRPFDGTDADVAEPGEVELDVGPLQARRDHAHATYAPGLVVNFGFAEGLELVVDVDGAIPFAHGRAGAVESDVLCKVVVRDGSLQGRRGPSLALETGVLLPGLPRDAGADAGWVASVVASQRWAEVAVHATATAAYDRDRTLAAALSAIVEGPQAWRVRPATEWVVARDRTSALAGAIWQYRKDLAFDGAAVVGRAAGADFVEVRLGWTMVM